MQRLVANVLVVHADKRRRTDVRRITSPCASNRPCFVWKLFAGAC
jgi:hypothetical protein